MCLLRMVDRHAEMFSRVHLQLCVVAVVFLQSYGWFVVLALAVAFYFKGHIEQAFGRWRSSRQQETDYHRYGTVSHLYLWTVPVLMMF